MNFHHIGIACTDISYMKNYLERLYCVSDISDEIFDELQGVDLCMVTLKDGTQIELICGETVSGFLKKRQFLYHICYTTKDLQKKIKEFESQGARIISEPKPAKLFEGKQVAFLMTELGIVELLEFEEENS